MKALVLAGGYQQGELVRELKKRGCLVVVADWGEKPIAREYADVFYRESTLDIPAIRRIAIKEKVDFIVTVCTDQAMVTMTALSAELGLPCYLDHDTAIKVTNKKYMKCIFEKNGINTAKFVIPPAGINDVQILNLVAAKKMKYPMIVKPVDCNSSKGVSKVLSENELCMLYRKALMCSRTGDAVIEEFINGIELTVDAYVENGKANVLATSVNEKIDGIDEYINFRTVHPPKIDNTENEIRGIAQKLAETFGLINSPMIIQLQYDGNSVCVTEFSARTGGGAKHFLIKHVSGFDAISAVTDLTMGSIPHLNISPGKSEYTVNEYIYCKSGVFDHLEGFEDMKREGLLAEYYQYKSSGTVFEELRSCGDRVAGFTFDANSIEELNKKQRIINEYCRVIDVKGNDIMRHDLFTEITGNYCKK